MIANSALTAIASKEVASLRYLLHHGAPCDQHGTVDISESGLFVRLRPVELAAIKGLPEAIDVLARAGACLDLPNQSLQAMAATASQASPSPAISRSPLGSRLRPIDYAAVHGHRDVIDRLISNGASWCHPDEPPEQAGAVVVGCAIANGHASLVDWLCHRLARSIRYEPGTLPPGWKGVQHVLTCLLFEPDRFMQRPRYALDCMEVLLRADADPNACDADSRPVLDRWLNDGGGDDLADTAFVRTRLQAQQVQTTSSDRHRINHPALWDDRATAHRRCVERLLMAGADPRRLDPSAGHADALFWALHQRSAPLALSLLEKTTPDRTHKHTSSPASGRPDSRTDSRPDSRPDNDPPAISGTIAALDTGMADHGTASAGAKNTHGGPGDPGLAGRPEPFADPVRWLQAWRLTLSTDWCLLPVAHALLDRVPSIDRVGNPMEVLATICYTRMKPAPLPDDVAGVESLVRRVLRWWPAWVQAPTGLEAVRLIIYWLIRPAPSSASEWRPLVQWLIDGLAESHIDTRLRMQAVARMAASSKNRVDPPEATAETIEGGGLAGGVDLADWQSLYEGLMDLGLGDLWPTFPSASQDVTPHPSVSAAL